MNDYELSLIKGKLELLTDHEKSNLRLFEKIQTILELQEKQIKTLINTVSFLLNQVKENDTACVK